MDTLDTESNMKLDPGDEVQRLQELVRTLEVQNQILRTKHSADSGEKLKCKQDSVVNDILVNKDRTSESSCGDNGPKGNRNSLDLGLLDVNTVPALEDEESW